MKELELEQEIKDYMDPYSNKEKANKRDIFDNNEEILKLLGELKDRFYDGKMNRLVEAECNESFIKGQQFGRVDGTLGNLSYNRNSWYKDVPKITVNLLSSIAGTWRTLLTKDRPSAYAVAKRVSDPTVQVSAQITTKVIEYLEGEIDVQHKLDKAADNCVAHGTGAFKIIYNPESNGIEWTPLSIFDYSIELNPDYQKSDFVLFKDKISYWKAKELLEAADFPDVNPTEEEFNTRTGEKSKGVVKYEIWYKPCYRFPSGVYACVIDNKVIEKSKYPYVFADEDAGKPVAILPLVMFICRNDNESPYGLTFITDCIPIQKGLNECVARLMKIMKQTSAIYRTIPKSLVNSDNLDDEAGTIVFDDSKAEAVSRMGFINPPQVSTLPFDQRADLQAKLYQVAGISELTTGQSNKTYSGRAVQYLAELDTAKNADALKSLNSALKSAWSLSIKLTQAYFQGSKIFAISDVDQPYDVEWTKEDIQGVNIRLEERSGTESYQASKKAQKQEELQTGVITPEQYRTDLGGVDSAISKRLAVMLIDEFLAGRPIDIKKTTFVPEIFLGIVQEKISVAILKKDISAVEALKTLADQYIMMISQEDGEIEDNKLKFGGAQDEQISAETTSGLPSPVSAVEKPLLNKIGKGKSGGLSEENKKKFLDATAKM